MPATLDGRDALLDEVDHYRLPLRATHPAQGWEHAFALALDIVRGFKVKMADAIHASTAAILSAPLLTDDLDFARLPASLLTIVTHPDQVEAAAQMRPAGGEMTGGTSILGASREPHAHRKANAQPV